MKPLTIALLAGGAVALIAGAPMTAAIAQAVDTTAVVPEHGNWTLKEREEWLHSRLNRARDDGSINHGEYERVSHELGDIHDDEERMRDHHDGQLTDNQTAELEARLDEVSDKIHWLHEDSFRRPW